MSELIHTKPGADSQKSTTSSSPLILFSHAGRETSRYQQLLEDSGYVVMIVPHEEAIAAAKTLKPAAIILQLGEPAIVGLASVRQFRTQAETRGTPLITFVRLDDAHTRELIVRAGATAILIEPVKSSILLRQMRRLLARALGKGLLPGGERPIAITPGEVSRA